MGYDSRHMFYDACTRINAATGCVNGPRLLAGPEAPVDPPGPSAFNGRVHSLAGVETPGLGADQ